MSTKEADLATLGLQGDPGSATIRQTYFKMALKCHPDKGGSTESFQTLNAAFERLQQDKYGPKATPRSSHPAQSAPPYTNYNFYNDEDEEDCGFGFGFQDYYESFFRNSANSSYESFTRHYKTPQDRAKERHENVKAHRDFRDRAGNPTNRCETCPSNAIDEKVAKSHGVNWKQYSAHPQKRKTCWACKNAHISVMTQNMAQKKFKNLSDGFFKELKRCNNGGLDRFIGSGGFDRITAIHPYPKTEF
ncbi:hypothetical protein HDU98_007080 [Podochytrium sp. JEL0797]|nr:hypothetical protein HDU98_007080 [Podochytrium sp. JEL0797]